MSFERPTLTQLADRAKDDLDARLDGADSRLRRSVLGTLATVQAGAAHGLYGYLDYLSRQILPDQADEEHLERWASVFGIHRKAATPAAGQVTLTGADGAVAPVGSVLQRKGGQEYVTTVAATIEDGGATVAVVAKTPGIASQAEAGVRLSLVSPIAGVGSGVVVADGGLVGGADLEDDALLRERLLARIRQAPAGGARHDYFNWTLEVAEVTRAWVYPGWAGAGTVGIAFMMDGRDDPIPTEDDITAVEGWVAIKAPVTADLVVFAPTPVPLNIEISGLSPDNEAVRAGVAAEIEDLLFRAGEPGGTILISQLREAVSIAAGETDHVLVSPTANVVLDPGELAVLGTIDWDG